MIRRGRQTALKTQRLTGGAFLWVPKLLITVQRFRKVEKGHRRAPLSAPARSGVRPQGPKIGDDGGCVAGRAEFERSDCQGARAAPAMAATGVNCYRHGRAEGKAKEYL